MISVLSIEITISSNQSIWREITSRNIYSSSSSNVKKGLLSKHETFNDLYSICTMLDQR